MIDFEIEKYESDLELKIDVNEDTLFKKTIRYFVVEFYVSVLIELWREQRRDKINFNVVLRDKQLSDLIDIFKREDWDRQRTEYVDRGLFIIIDDYESGKMMKGII